MRPPDLLATADGDVHHEAPAGAASGIHTMDHRDSLVFVYDSFYLLIMYLLMAEGWLAFCPPGRFKRWPCLSKQLHFSSLQHGMK